MWLYIIVMIDISTTGPYTNISNVTGPMVECTMCINIIFLPSINIEPFISNKFVKCKESEIWTLNYHHYNSHFIGGVWVNYVSQEFVIIQNCKGIQEIKHICLIHLSHCLIQLVSLIGCQVTITTLQSTFKVISWHHRDQHVQVEFVSTGCVSVVTYAWLLNCH